MGTDREAKLLALGKQRKALEDGIKNEEPKLSLAILYGYIDKHKVNQKNACEIMPTNTAKTLTKLRAVLADAKANKLVCSLEPGSEPLPDGSKSEAPASTDTTDDSKASTSKPTENKESTDKAPVKQEEDKKAEEKSVAPLEKVFDTPVSKSESSSTSGSDSTASSAGSAAGSGSAASSSSGTEAKESDDPLASPATKDEVKSESTKEETIPSNTPPEKETAKVDAVNVQAPQK